MKRIFTEEHRRKLSEAHKGKRLSPDHALKFGKYWLGKREEEANIWKGDNVGYRALHSWIDRKIGKPNFCAQCFSKEAKRYEWANISGKYHRDLNDFTRLCISCHLKFDRGNLILSDYVINYTKMCGNS